MARNYLARATATNVTPQSEPIPGSLQVPNSAGGFSFALDKWKRLERFLVLGAEGGTYYITERKLALENATCVAECLKDDPLRTVNMIVNVSDAGRAPNNDPALFALALAMSSGPMEVRQAAEQALPKVARIGTHLFHFAEFAARKDGTKRTFRGWGALLRRAVRNWYLAKDTGKLVYQLVKYQSRDGWSHRDLLRLSHPKATSKEKEVAFRWAVSKLEPLQNPPDHLPRVANPLALIWAFEEAKTADEKRTIMLISDYGLPRECVRTELLRSPAIWDALLHKMPLTAMIRNLGNMTSIGLLAPNSAATAVVIAALSNRDALKRQHIHPLQVFMADATYRQGHGTKGSNKWEPVMALRNQLDETFYSTFDFVEPTGRRWFLGLDVSGSMGAELGRYPITCREASALMALVTMRTEKIHFVGGFTTGNRGMLVGNPFTPLNISANMKMEDVRNKISGLDFGGTDCALPMLYAMKHKIPADVFVIYTDNETWAGDIHPVQALQQYRDATGIPAKLAVVGMTSNGFTIADPNDAGMLDVVGFDTTVPRVLSDFATDGQLHEENSEEEL